MISPLLLASLIATAALLYGIVIPLLHYFCDPKGLRRYTNLSLFAGISDIPYCYLSAAGFRSKALTEAHKDTPVIRLGPNNLSFGHRDAIKAIYGHSTTCLKDLKYSITAAEHPNLFDVVDRSKHAENRKRLSAAFATKNLERWVFKVARTTERLLNAFDERCSSPPTSTGHPEKQIDTMIDFNHWINLFTIEAINYIALSSEMDLLDTGEDMVTARKRDGTLYRAPYRKSQNTSAYATSHFVWDYTHFRIFKRLSKLVPSWQRIWKTAEPWQDVIYQQAAVRKERFEAGEDLDDFFSVLMHDKSGKPYNLAWEEVVSEIGAIIDAGADTTSIALTQVLELLIRHPQHLQTLREEVDAVLSPDDIVASYDAVKNLPFLRAVLDEAMRIIPPTSAGLPRRTPPEGTEIMGQWIAGDTSVSMPIYTMHHDPEIFPHPEEFNPHRWMDPEERKWMNPYFIPFSTGGRGCLGRNISYLEQMVVLSSLVHRYDFELPGGDWMLKRFEAFNLIVGEMPIKIWRRALTKG
jgi:cytochrome P450